MIYGRKGRADQNFGELGPRAAVLIGAESGRPPAVHILTGWRYVDAGGLCRNRLYEAIGVIYSNGCFRYR